ncbi:acyl-CoA carboxylase subunit epsilon [Microbacterium betulae]|uniref:Acyl-CoA carboxylase subunit epsilon n=1 Tax=Microbacterium betulae TaxID=2981139 RepID=A0AA97FKU5_9MICO|nr:acyl-CoA carboxylase subunit epsilon [Microbacterium sp. AB]WOF24155.1 acyl-CoA carboxylase subunit epsilon [Microbacterium sp. AB]
MTDQNDIPRVDVVRGTPTAEELAALIAVVSEAYSVETATAVVEDPPATADWARSRRLRRPLARGAWGRFRG